MTYASVLQGYVQLIEKQGPLNLGPNFTGLDKIGELYNHPEKTKKLQTPVFITPKKPLHKVCRTYRSFDLNQLQSRWFCESSLYLRHFKTTCTVSPNEGLNFADEAEYIKDLETALKIMSLVDKFHIYQLEKCDCFKGGRIEAN